MPEAVLVRFAPALGTLCQCQVRSVRRWVRLLYPWELDYAIDVYLERCLIFARCFEKMPSRCWIAAEVSFYLMRRRRDKGDVVVYAE